MGENKYKQRSASFDEPSRANKDLDMEALTAPNGIRGGPDVGRRVLERLLPSGGDERSQVNPATGKNKYNVPMKPFPGGVHRSSCTCNVVTEEAMKVGEKLAEKMLSSAINGDGDVQDEFCAVLQDVRDRLRKAWHVQKDFALTLTPSGTDAELLPLLVALARSADAVAEDEDAGAGVLNIVMAAGEVGSGTTDAARGKVFSPLLPNESNPDLVQPALCNVGDDVFPLFNIQAMQVFLRDAATGEVKDLSHLDEKVERIVTQALDSGDYRTVIVHLVAGCKTGHIVPSAGCVLQLVRKYGDKVLPVVDACQMRNMKELSLRRFLEIGFTVVCTGSKFYGGPPFSGAVIFPPLVAKELEQRLAANPQLCDCIRSSKLKDYIDSSVVSDELPTLQGLLPRKLNYGLLMRWALALFEVERYHQVPVEVRETVITEWVQGVKAIAGECPEEIVSLYDGDLAHPYTPLGPLPMLEEGSKKIDPNENLVFGIGLPRTGAHSLAEGLRACGYRGMQTCVLTKDIVKHHPKTRKVIGLFELDNSYFLKYKELFEENPNSKFILMTRNGAEWAKACSRHNQDHFSEVGLVLPGMDEYVSEVTQFFVTKRASQRLLVVDVLKQSDEVLWQNLMDFVIPQPLPRPFQPKEYPFPRTSVEPCGRRDSKTQLKKVEQVHTAMDAEMLPAQVNSIVSLQLKRRTVKKSGASAFERMTNKELKHMYSLMATDLSEFAQEVEAANDAPAVLRAPHSVTSVLGRECFIGQPVTLNAVDWSRSAGRDALRVAISAPIISAFWETALARVSHQPDAKEIRTHLPNLLEDDRIVLSKMCLILLHWDLVSKPRRARGA